MNVERSCLVILLPDEAGGNLAWWRVVAGRPVDSGEGAPAALPEMADPTSTAAEPVVLAVPGADCLVRWLDLRAHTTVQATAAARALLAGQLAVEPAGLHVAVAADGRDRWLAVTVDPARVDDWLGQAQDLGVRPHCLVPAPLLLPVPEAEPEAITVAHRQDHWLARGSGLAFAAEPALARRMLAERRQVLLGDLGAALAKAAMAPPVNLLQGRYAPGEASHARPGWRRAGRLALAALLLGLLSPALLAAAHHWQAGRLEQQAVHQAAAALPPGLDTNDPVALLRDHLAGARNATDFSTAMAALLPAVEQVPGTSLDALSWADGLLWATVDHGGDKDLQDLAAALSEAGHELVEHDTSLQAGIAHTRVSLEPVQ